MGEIIKILGSARPNLTINIVYSAILNNRIPHMPCYTISATGNNSLSIFTRKES